jgi:hypothetical protein
MHTTSSDVSSSPQPLRLHLGITISASYTLHPQQTLISTWDTPHILGHGSLVCGSRGSAEILAGLSDVDAAAPVGISTPLGRRWVMAQC